MELIKIQYDNKIVKAFIIATVIFGIVGMSVGLLAAIQLFYPLFNFDLPYTSFGRIRPCIPMQSFLLLWATPCLQACITACSAC
jgi:Cbb3-type cytochrome oxidase, subunit 1